MKTRNNMNNVLNLIAEFKQLELKIYPHKEIKSLITKIGGFPITCEGLYIGEEIIRARRNISNESYLYRKDLSYVPKEFNNKYQRASTPNKTMFYGCPLKRMHLRKPKDLDINDLLLISCLEVSNLLKTDADGEERITFSRWAVTKTIKLCAMYCHKEFIVDDSHENEIYKIYLSELNRKSDPQYAKCFLEVLTFFSDEFAKEINNGSYDYDYMISAIFAELIVESERAGIYYPSVQTKYSNKIGYNVAITPETTDTSLKLISSLECTLYKKGNEVYIDQDRVAFITNNNNKLEYNQVATEDHLGKDLVLEFLEGEISSKQIRL